MGDLSWNARVTANSVRKASEEEQEEKERVEAYESGAGLDGALEMSRAFLSESLTNAGFMDIHAGTITRLRTFLQQGLKEPEEVETGLDIRTAGELATFLGSQPDREVNLVLRILARIDPERVATLLR
jgi:hypothetical protein